MLNESSTRPPMDHAVLLLSDQPHAELAIQATHIENLGYDGIWYADERFFHDPYVGLATIANATERVFVGPGVADPRSRHPALVAMGMNSIQDISNGRAVLGFGAGKSGFHNLGLTNKNSARAMREGIEVIRSLLAHEETTLHGEVVEITSARMRVEPQEVPICVAANGPLTLELAGEVGDSVMIPHCRSPELLAHKMASVKAGAERAGRDEMPRLILRLDASVSNDGAAAVRAAKARLARTIWAQYPTVDFLQILELELPDNLDRLLAEAGPFPYSFDLAPYERFADAVPNAFVDAICLAGSPTEVAVQVDELATLGVDEITFLAVPPPDMTSEEVIDLYAEAAGMRNDTDRNQETP